MYQNEMYHSETYHNETYHNETGVGGGGYAPLECCDSWDILRLCVCQL